MGTSPQTPVHYRRGFMLPVMLMVFGMMFLLDNLVPGWGWRKTWPLLLIIIGGFKLLDIALPPRPPEGPRV